MLFICSLYYFKKNINIYNIFSILMIKKKSEIKIFVLHYSKLVERKKNILEQFSKHNITNFEFVEKYDKNEIDDNNINKFIINYDKATMSLFLKFIYSIREIVNKYNFALILEDDVILSENFSDFLFKYIEELPNDYDLLFIGDGANFHIEKDIIKPDKFIYKKCLNSTQWGGDGCTRCCDSFLINKKCAIKILDYFYRIEDKTKSPFDLWLNEVARYFNLIVYWAEPTIVSQGSENGIFKSSLR